MKYLFEQKTNWVILGLIPIALILVLKASDEKCLFESCSLLSQFEIGNSIIFNLGMGYLVSTMFWLLAIVLPKIEKRKLWISLLLKDFKEFKQYCLELIVEQTDGAYDSNLRLIPGSKFKIYIDENNRWNRFRNDLQSDNQLRHLLISQMEKLQVSFDYAFSVMDFESKSSLDFYRDLTNEINRLKQIPGIEYEQDKYIGQFLYGILTWHTTVTGALDYDPVEKRIREF